MVACVISTEVGRLSPGGGPCRVHQAYVVSHSTSVHTPLNTAYYQNLTTNFEEIVTINHKMV